jgi:hypothetical protein
MGWDVITFFARPAVVLSPSLAPTITKAHFIRYMGIASLHFFAIVTSLLLFVEYEHHLASWMLSSHWTRGKAPSLQDSCQFSCIHDSSTLSRFFYVSVSFSIYPRNRFLS